MRAMSPLPESTIQERFALALHATERAWRLGLDARLKTLGVGQSGWLAIAAIAKAPSALSQRELADRLGVESPSMAAMIDRLEGRGLVARIACPTDRRIKLLLLTDTGRALHAQIRAAADAFRARVLEGVDPVQLERVSGLLDALCAHIQVELAMPSPGRSWALACA